MEYTELRHAARAAWRAERPGVNIRWVNGRPLVAVRVVDDHKVQAAGKGTAGARQIDHVSQGSVAPAKARPVATKLPAGPALRYDHRVTDVHVLHVFTDDQGNYGDVATVIFDEGRRISESRREEIAGALDAVETAFVNNAADRQVSFVHGQGEIDFAGVPAVGVAWLLGKREGHPISAIHGRGGDIVISHEGGLTWVRASLETMPPWNHVQYDNPEAIDRIMVAETANWEHTMVWAWIDERNGLIRARTFAADWDIAEAMGNGSGSMMLAAILGQAIEIRHGEGSVIYARPAGNGLADIGGRVKESAPIVV